MSSPVRYVVRRQEYTPPTAAGVRRVLPEKWTTVATFAKPNDAYVEWAKLTADARRTLNPFQLGGPSLFYQTSLPAFAFHDYLLDHGLTPPPTSTSSNPNYVFWWVKNNRTFTDAQRAVVWQACDKLKLFEVVEEDDRRAAWLVVEVPWDQAETSRWATSDEGGYFRSAWRTVRDAKKATRAIEPSLREQFLEGDEVSVTGRLGYEGSPSLVDGDDVPVAEIHRVSRSDSEITPALLLIVRQSYGTEKGCYATEPAFGEHNWGVRVALGAATLRATATELAHSLATRARRTVNPFALIWPDEIFGGWGQGCPPHTLLTEDELVDRRLPNDIPTDEAFEIIRRLDTTPPPPEANELLADWYDQVVQWSPDYIDVIWGTFADFRLFEVIEVPFG